MPQVFEVLRAAIVGLDLEPGAVINRAELQARFRLSSTPIRDALIRLADEGLVEIVPQSATRVSLIDVGQAQQTQFLRRSLELEVVATLCGASDKSVVVVLRALIDAQKEAAREGDLVRFDRLDLEFHQRMYEAAGVAELYALVRSRSGHIDRLRSMHLPVAGRVQDIVRQHASIVKAITAGDVSAAQRGVREHLSRSLAYSPALREKRPDYFRRLRASQACRMASTIFCTSSASSSVARFVASPAGDRRHLVELAGKNEGTGLLVRQCIGRFLPVAAHLALRETTSRAGGCGRRCR